VTGLSVLSSLGRDVEELAASLRAQRRGLSPDHRYSAHVDGWLGTISPSTFAPARADLADEVAGVRALGWCLEDLAARTRLFERHAPERVGLYLGTSNSGVETLLDDGSARLADALEAAMARLFPLRGPRFTFCTACSSAAHALGQAALAVAAGDVDAAVAGGVDLLNGLAVSGFDALQILDREPCRPFHESRAGISLGEGGALLLLERAHSFRGRALGAVAGFGSSSDAHHITHPDPTGRGMRRAMEAALRSARIAPSDVGYVNAHGTGTRANDAAEALAVAELFGARTPVSSTKGLHGHVLGSAGALEAAVSLLALREGVAWAGATLEGGAYEPGVRVPRVARRRKIDVALSNSFGFGGTNASLILGRVTD